MCLLSRELSGGSVLSPVRTKVYTREDPKTTEYIHVSKYQVKGEDEKGTIFQPEGIQCRKF